MPVDRVCQWCNKGFQVRPHKIKEGKGKFCSHSCSTSALLTGKRSRGWKGGRHNFDGYVAVHAPGHPNASVQQRRYVLEHRLVMSEFLGRPLRPGEVVHHINGNKKDNRISNLLLTTQSEHMKLHMAADIEAAG